MNKILFVGPVASTGGPAIKNRILVDNLKKIADIEICNTYNQSIKARLNAITSILFSREKYIIIAVSRKGRLLLYPLMYIRSIFDNARFSCIVIGGNVVSSLNSFCVKALKKADIVTVETKGIVQQVEKEFKLCNVHYMPNYKESLSIYRASECPDKFLNKELKLLFLSSMRNAKGIKTLISAFKKVREIKNNITLDFYGPIKSDFDMELLDIINNTEGMKYCGEVENKDVLKTMEKYHVFVFPTEYINEGFPAVLVEAQLVGMPVIASDINYNPEIINNHINGWIFKNGNDEELKDKILYCENNRNMLSKISCKNIDDAKKYDSDTVIGKYVCKLREMGWPL